MSGDDPFGDMHATPELLGYGSLGGPGVEQHYRAQMAPASDGTGITAIVTCDRCGMRQRVTVAWQEFVIGSAGALPPNWVYNQKYAAMQPHLGCPQCQAPLMLLFTPDECARHVKSGIAAGHIDAQQATATAQQVRQRIGAMRR